MEEKLKKMSYCQDKTEKLLATNWALIRDLLFEIDLRPNIKSSGVNFLAMKLMICMPKIPTYHAYSYLGIHRYRFQIRYYILAD